MEKQHLFDKPGRVKRLLGIFYLSLVLLVVADLFIQKHPDFAWETFPSFYAAFGFVSCVLLVLAAKYILRPLVRRREGYYE